MRVDKRTRELGVRGTFDNPRKQFVVNDSFVCEYALLNALFQFHRATPLAKCIYNITAMSNELMLVFLNKTSVITATI